MSLLNLPDDILIIILKLLDVRSLYNFYNTCDRIQDIVRSYGVIKKCDLSLSVMAKAATLKSAFFLDISRNLKELNACGMWDLYKSGMLPVFVRLKCLTTLDITFTNITMTDFIELYSMCPTIKDISINFLFNMSPNNFNKTKLQPYQEVFKNFLNVHFVGSLQIMMHSFLPCVILKKAKLKKLQYTIIDTDYNSYTLQDRDIFQFENFIIHFKKSKIQNPERLVYQGYGSMLNMVPFDQLVFASYESMILILRSRNCLTKLIIYATPMFADFIRNHCNLNQNENIDLLTLHSFEVDLSGNGNVNVMLWDKSVTKFDQNFFSNLWFTLKPMLPCYFNSSFTNTPVDPNYYLYVTVPHEMQQVNNMETYESGFKRKRMCLPNYVLNYDTVFEEKDKIELIIMIDSSIKRAVSLSSRCNYLNKITFLSLCGQARYSMDFFNILFRCCNNLTTLRIKGNSFISCSAAIARSLPLSHSIKNIYLIDRSIDFSTLFSSFSQCNMLENVHILQTSSNNTNFTEAASIFQKCVLEKCHNLYCFYMYICSSSSAKRKFMQKLKLTHYKRINFKLLMNTHLICDPYSDMFRLNLF